MSRQVVTSCIVNPRVIGQHQVFESLIFLLILLPSSCPGSRGAHDSINTLTVFNRSLKGLRFKQVGKNDSLAVWGKRF